MYIVILGLENSIINSAINNDASVISLHSPNASMTKCKGPHHAFDDFTTYDFHDFTTCDWSRNSFLHYKSGF